MRSILVVVGLLIAFGTSADAATKHHAGTWHRLPPNVASSYNFAPGRGYERTAPPVQYTAPPVQYEVSPPAFNDSGPNNLGGLVGGNPNGA
jgi:hypothetical protein